MKKKNYLYLAALAMVAAACSTEETPALSVDEQPAPAARMITETVTATNGDNQAATRAAIGDDAVFTWSDGDQIAVHMSDGRYSITDALAQGEGGKAAADFTVSHSEDVVRNGFAVYPASIVAADAASNDLEGNTLDVTLPGSYTLAQVSGTTTPCPMIATNNPDEPWEFKQLCSLLRLTVNGIPAKTEYLTIDFDGKKVQGDFAIEGPIAPGTSVIKASATDGDDDILTITDLGITDWTNGMVLNLPLPIGEYTKITVTAYNSNDKVIILGKYSFSNTTARAKGRKATAALPSLISVSEDKMVYFAPGNLQYLGNADGTGTWRFAEHQYDFIGDGPSSGTKNQGNVTIAGYTKFNDSADKDAARDLFGWGTSGYNGKDPWMTSTSSGSYFSGDLAGTDFDWGVYHSASGKSSEKIINGGDYSWRLFTSEEWAYAIARKKKINLVNENLFAAATVVGVKGIILFPDNWTGSSDISITYGNKTGAGYTNTLCDAETWAKFEKQGCVFLPAANVRSGLELNYLDEGQYWSSTAFSVLNNTELRGGSLDFSETGTVTTSPTNNNVRRLGNSVRLIREVE